MNCLLTRRINRRGYVLVVVLGLLAALLIMGLSLGTAVRSNLAQSRRFQDDTAAEFVARGGIEWVIHYLNQLERREELWRAPWQHQSALFRERGLGPGTFDIVVVEADDSLRYGLQDEEARVHLNRAPAELLAALPGLSDATAGDVVQGRRQQPWSVPEALLGAGIVTPMAFYGTASAPGAAPYVTAWGSGKINVNTAPRQVLAVVPGVTPQQAEAIVRYRQGDDGQPGTADDQHFRRLDDLGRLPGLSAADLDDARMFLTVEPTAFRFVVTGRVPGQGGAEQTHRRLAIIDRSARPMRVHSWQKRD